MASHPLPISFTKEATNYARLCRLLIEVGSQVLREKFNDIHDPANLHIILHSCMPKLKSLRSRGILSQAQWDSMNPAIHKMVSSENFDISTLCVLLINICNLSPPATSWRRPPASMDHSLGADILRMRHFRNSLYAHVTKASIDETSFNSHWNDIREVLLRLGGAKYDEVIRRKGQRSLVMEKLSPSDPCRIVSITGPPGFGKSAVAIQVGRELVSQGKIDVFYITLKSMRSLNGMVNSLPQSNHTIIILDDVDDMLLPEKKDAFCNFVKSVAQTASRVKFMITSRQIIDFYLSISYQSAWTLFVQTTPKSCF